MIFAVIGGIGVGKSTVLRILENSYSIEGCYSDELAKGLYTPGSRVYEELVSEIGDGIINKESGELKTAALADLIFRSSELRSRVNAIVHPAVWALIEERIQRARSVGTDLAVETALPTTHFIAECDKCIFVYAEREVRIRRLMAGRGYSRNEAVLRLSSQGTEDEFRSMADVCINNSGTVKECEDEIYQYFQRLKR